MAALCVIDERLFGTRMYSLSAAKEMVRTCRCFFFLVHWWCSRPWHMGQASYAQKRHLEISHGWEIHLISTTDAFSASIKVYKSDIWMATWKTGKPSKRAQRIRMLGNDDSIPLYRIQGKGVISFSFIWFPNKKPETEDKKTVRESKTPAETGPTWPKLAIRLQLCGSGIDLFWL